MDFDPTIGPFDDFVVIIGQHLGELIQEFGNRMVLTIRVVGVVSLVATVIIGVIVIFIAIDDFFVWLGVLSIESCSVRVVEICIHDYDCSLFSFTRHR